MAKFSLSCRYILAISGEKDSRIGVIWLDPVVLTRNWVGFRSGFLSRDGYGPGFFLSKVGPDPVFHERSDLDQIIS